MVEKFLMDVAIAAVVLMVMFVIIKIANKLNKIEELSMFSFFVFAGLMMIGYIFTSVVMLCVAAFFMLLCISSFIFAE